MEIVTWFGFKPLPQPNDGPPSSATLPSFSLDTNLLGGQYSPRQFPIPAVNFSVSRPGVYFVGIYGAWNGEYGYSSPKPENGVRTLHSFPLVAVDGKASSSASKVDTFSSPQNIKIHQMTYKSKLVKNGRSNEHACNAIQH